MYTPGPTPSVPLLTLAWASEDPSEQEQQSDGQQSVARFINGQPPTAKQVPQIKEQPQRRLLESGVQSAATAGAALLALLAYGYEAVGTLSEARDCAWVCLQCRLLAVWPSPCTPPPPRPNGANKPKLAIYPHPLHHWKLALFWVTLAWGRSCLNDGFKPFLTRHQSNKRPGRLKNISSPHPALPAELTWSGWLWSCVEKSDTRSMPRRREKVWSKR